MDIKEAQKALRGGLRPSPDYPDLPNDFTAEELIAYDPNAEIEYRMAKDRNPGITRAMIVQNWKAFKIAQRFRPGDGRASGKQDGGPGFLRTAAEFLKKKGGGT